MSQVPVQLCQHQRRCHVSPEPLPMLVLVPVPLPLSVPVLLELPRVCMLSLLIIVRKIFRKGGRLGILKDFGGCFVGKPPSSINTPIIHIPGKFC